MFEQVLIDQLIYFCLIYLNSSTNQSDTMDIT